MTLSKILAALAVGGVLIAAGCGDDDKTSNSASKSGGNGADRAFVADMVPHHQSAIQMAKIARDRGESAFVKDLADDIVITQTEEIKVLRREDEGLDMAGITVGSLGVPEHMKGMDDDPAMLKTADPFDAAFLKMMISHHQGAIEMAKAELAKGTDRELRAVASDIINGQKREIADMRKHAGNAGNAGGADDTMNNGNHGSGHSG